MEAGRLKNEGLETWPLKCGGWRAEWIQNLALEMWRLEGRGASNLALEIWRLEGEELEHGLWRLEVPEGLMHLG